MPKEPKPPKQYKFSKYLCTSTSRPERNQLARTPKALYEQLDERFHFDFDPCPTNPTFDGLKSPWGNMNYVNPPYREVNKWLLKAIKEQELGKTSVMLIPVRTSSKYWYENVFGKGAEIEFIYPKLTFEPYTVPAPWDCAIVIYRGKKVEELSSKDNNVTSKQEDEK